MKVFIRLQELSLFNLGRVWDLGLKILELGFGSGVRSGLIGFRGFGL